MKVRWHFEGGGWMDGRSFGMVRVDVIEASLENYAAS